MWLLDGPVPPSLALEAMFRLQKAAHHIGVFPEALLLFVAKFVTKILGCFARVALIVVFLFCLAIFSGDVAYMLLRMFVPEHEVWTARARNKWMIAWSVVWLCQVPWWLAAMERDSGYSLLLMHEQANLAVTVYQKCLQTCLPYTRRLWSVTLLASSEQGEQPSLVSSLVGRLALPFLYVTCYGMPHNPRAVLVFIVMDVVPLLVNSTMKAAPRFAQESWQLCYRPCHPALDCLALARARDKRGHDADEVMEPIDECEEHGVCPICLDSLCTPGRGGVVSGAGRFAPLSLIRQRQKREGGSVFASAASVAGISAARMSLDWRSGRIARTRCGHEFHASCLQLAAESSIRCPKCRMGLAASKGGVEIPDEEAMDAQFLYLVCGVSLGASLMSVCWICCAGDNKEMLELIDYGSNNATKALSNLTTALGQGAVQHYEKKIPTIVPVLGSLASAFALGFAFSFGLP
eukprot:TRINITY_DN36480_c0_g1_i1.p1 TRINITY_DN36480_c0_g1~~TRINITY_DN36480_c0_g1_i1.p1  ORF type:complete len:463 (-),score=95.98 TRINITY_DN36480_c0_g1_i1:109-1497(-)